MERLTMIKRWNSFKKYPPYDTIIVAKHELNGAIFLAYFSTEHKVYLVNSYVLKNSIFHNPIELDIDKKLLRWKFFNFDN